MSPSRISWMVTVGTCLVASVLLLLNGYSGYSGVLLAVGAAAAVNLLGGPEESDAPPRPDAD